MSSLFIDDALGVTVSDLSLWFYDTFQVILVYPAYTNAAKKVGRASLAVGVNMDEIESHDSRSGVRSHSLSQTKEM